MSSDKNSFESKDGRNRRRRDRFALSLPIKVYCRETTEPAWEEVTRLIDVTPFGAGFTLTREIGVGRLLRLVMPLPRQLRCYDHIEPQYQVWSVVRHVSRSQDGEHGKQLYTIGAAFIGKRPPASYEIDPATVYEIMAADELGFCRLREKPREQGAENQAGVNATENADGRRVTRHPIPLTVRIEVLDDRGETVASEMTATENLNAQGALVFTTLSVENGRFVRLTSDQYNASLVAVVRRRRIGADGVGRLHLEFIDRQFPLETVE